MAGGCLAWYTWRAVAIRTGRLQPATSNCQQGYPKLKSRTGGKACLATEVPAKLLSAFFRKADGARWAGYWSNWPFSRQQLRPLNPA